MSKDKKFYRGSVNSYDSREMVDKAVSRVTAMPLEEAIDETGLTSKQLRERYHCFNVDGQTYVQL
ncbi:hypothetical protein [Solidesulfovibrio carbinolicus]|uniref:Uncharacterized protein n=1 Tax=Solidesulfovibrio carbinolicus TaxID=296842 RepID=A0A4P6HSK2_9BACT|nr:hypothetical protein [Solidesulfovibrio carbinolicus]QAZ69684.1 hypothetical protein C3Y92_20625 [Solidesulfovibrio carbinolicus]